MSRRLRGTLAVVLAFALVLSVSGGIVAALGTVISNTLKAEIEVLDVAVYNEDQDSWHPTIQEAVDEANEGNTLIAYPGTYEEDLDVHKPVTIKASEEHQATVEGGTIDIIADNVTIDGFIIDHGEGDRAIAPRDSDGTTIKNNKFQNAVRAIQGDVHGRPTSLTVTGNTFDSTVDHGIAGTEEVTGLVITGNTFRTTEEGVGLGAGVGFDNLEKDFADNTFAGDGIHVGLYNEDKDLPGILVNNTFDNELKAVVTDADGLAADYAIEDVADGALADIISLEWVDEDLDPDYTITAAEYDAEFEVAQGETFHVTLEAALGTGVDMARGGEADIMAVDQVLYVVELYEDAGMETAIGDVFHSDKLVKKDDHIWYYGPRHGFLFADAVFSEFEGADWYGPENKTYDDGVAETEFDARFDEDGTYYAKIDARRLDREE